MKRLLRPLMLCLGLAAAAPATSQMPTEAASATRQSGRPGVASSMPMTAQKTMSCTTRGLVSA